MRGMPWTDENDRVLAANWQNHGMYDPVWRQLLPGRTPEAIKSRAGRLGLIRRADRFTPEEDELIRTNYPLYGSTASVWAELISNRTSSSIADRARKLGLNAPSPEERTKNLEAIGKAVRRTTGKPAKPKPKPRPKKPERRMQYFRERGYVAVNGHTGTWTLEQLRHLENAIVACEIVTGHTGRECWHMMDQMLEVQ